MPPGSPFRRGTSLNPFRPKDSLLQSPSLTRRQAYEVDQTPQPSATSKSWFRTNRQSQNKLFKRGSSNMAGRQEDAQIVLEEEVEYWKNRNQQQEMEMQEMEHSLGEKHKESTDLQARWNLENFKYNLLVDMVGNFLRFIARKALHLQRLGIALLKSIKAQWAMRVLDNEQLSSKT